MTEAEINALTFAALQEYRPEGLLFGALQVRWGSSSRAIGFAHYPSEKGQAVGDRPSIRYSRPLMTALPEAEQRDTVIHEVAHLLVSDDWTRRRLGDDFFRGAPPKGHGLEWRVWMIKMGGKPRVTCSDTHVNDVSRALITEKRLARGGVAMKCLCREWVLTAKQARRGAAYCRKCQAFLAASE